MKYSIVDKEKAAALKEKFIYSFVNQNSEWYQTNIAVLEPCEDGDFYSGYLWEGLKDNSNYELECTIENACAYLATKNKTFIMWDLFSKTRISDPSYFANAVARDSVILMNAQEAAGVIMHEWYSDWGNERYFPEDLYCFDESMSWFVVFTHEGWDCFTAPDKGLSEDDYIRICFKF